jgi:glyoxylase-like metal-dependent hydrolase (beta-lactamase superfamily II)
MIIDIEPGLWIWRVDHPQWEPAQGGDRVVTSVCVEEGGEIVVIDALAPPPGTGIWERLDSSRPTMAVVLKPDHVRSVDLFVDRYGIPAYGPDVFQKDDVPTTDMELIYPGYELPGGFVALYDGRGRNETPLWLPDHRTIVFADALTTFGGRLQVWATPWHEERALPALRAMLELPVEKVIISHGEPVHTREEFERALAREPIAAD